VTKIGKVARMVGTVKFGRETDYPKKGSEKKDL